MGPRDQLLDVVDEGPLDPHAATLRSVLGCDAALVTLIDVDEQRFLGMHGLPRGEARRRRGTPLDHSLCRDVVASDAVLRIDDLTADATYRDHPALPELGVAAYLGVPLRVPGGDVVGAVCGLHAVPRSWSNENLVHLERVRDLVQDELRRLLGESEQRAAHDELSLVLSTLRHELGGQLAIVLGGIETAMLDGIDQGTRDRVLGNAGRDCRRAISTLDALLRTDHRAPSRIADTDLAALAVDVVDGVAAAHETDRVHVVAEPTRLVTDATLVGHVLRNLVDNACKYSDGLITVTVHPAGSSAQLLVHDRGGGIPTDVVDQLYEPFSRRRSDGGASGFGLGLYIIRTLCQRLGAGLAVDTGADGTTVTVTIPGRGQSPKPSKAASSSDGA